MNSSLREQLDYTESSVTLSAHQLVGRDWVFGGVYRASRVQLDASYPDISEVAAAQNKFTARTSDDGTLQTLNLQAIYQNPAGFFARLDGIWTRQENGGDMGALAGDNFWQCNVLAGHRFFHRHAEISAGILNLTAADYHLNPLNLYQETPRDRTFYTQFKFQF